MKLINAGADVTAVDERGLTPFDYAKDNPYLDDSDAFRLLEEATHGLEQVDQGVLLGCR